MGTGYVVRRRALIALANARRGAPLGLVNPILYRNPDLFRPITQGDNRVGELTLDGGRRVFADRFVIAAGPWSETFLRQLGQRPGLNV